MRKKQIKMNYRMVRKAVITMTALTVGLGISMTANAKPKTMPDGTVFDAEYYGAAYPDVAKALGTDEGLLYQHYQQFGKAEGRICTQPEAEAEKENNDSVRAQVNALGITYDPSRDAEIPAQNYVEHPITRAMSAMEVGERNYQLVRADYTNDPLYLAIARELVSYQKLYQQECPQRIYDHGYVRYSDYVGDIYFGDRDMDYLTNLVGNLSLDYLESILRPLRPKYPYAIQDGGFVRDISVGNEYFETDCNRDICVQVDPSLGAQFHL